MRRIALALTVTFLLIPIFDANGAVKAGSICSKLGANTTSGGKKFTCIKSGKKLIWNKGVIITKPLPSPSPSVASTPTASSSPSTTNEPSNNSQNQTKNLSLDPRITRDTTLENVQACKIKDLTFQPGNSNGFPRPEGVFPGKGNPKVLVLPLVFSDQLYTSNDLELITKATSEVTSLYKKITFGKINFEFEIAPEIHWVQMPNPTNTYEMHRNIPQFNRQKAVEDAFANASANINFESYDGVILESGRYYDFGSGQGFSGMTFNTKSGKAKRVSLEFGSQTANTNTIAHEFGHSFFGFEDIYLFENYVTPTTNRTPAGPWDFMTGTMQELFGWSKLLMGSLDDSDVVCITNQTSVVTYLENIDSVSGDKLAIINLSEGKNIVLESRNLTGNQEQLLVYEVDTNKPHGGGPITAESKLYSKNEIVKMNGYRIKVLDDDAKGILLEINKSS